MDLTTFEHNLKYISDWVNYPLTELEQDFIMEQASYMSDRDRAFFVEILQKLMGKIV